MEVRSGAQGWAGAGRVAVLAALLLCLWCRAAAERVRYAIPEELAAGSLVGPLARDLGLSADELPARKLRIVAGDEKQYFTLEDDNRNLRVNDRIDRETICGAVSPCVLSLEAVVENPFDIFHVSVTIQDINDNAPQFDGEFVTIEMIESTPPGTRFPLGSGRDPDIGANSLQNYELTPNPLFSLLVRESPDGTKTRGTDANDNPPVFTKEIYTVRLMENLPEGSLAFQVKATDNDEGTNAEITYSFRKIAKNIRQLFTLDPSTGDVKVTGALDYEESKYYEIRSFIREHIQTNNNQRPGQRKCLRLHITITATDRGRPALRSSAELVLEVSDVNDNAPVFEEAAYSAYVAENNAAGALVLRVQARDADAGANGRVSYWLAGGSAGAAGAAPPVSVEARSGALYAQRSFDYERCREFAVAVRAQDGGAPARSSTATVRVFVLDRNDNAPRVLWPAAAAAAGEAAGAAASPFEVVPRSAEAGYLVAKVVAVDADAGRNAWLSYELVQASEPALFRVGLHSGEVRTARAVSERDAAKQRLVAVEALPELSERAAGAEAPAAELHFYLVLALALLSALFLLSVALAVLARLRRAGPPAVLRCLGAQRFSVAGAAFPADFCEGTLPYSYNLCVAAPARALPEAAWPPPPVPVLSAEELLSGDSCQKPSPNSGAETGEPPADPDAPQVCKASRSRYSH
ncbi:hypothetical protein DUI87_26984 [Hirundo rustica rustica]|uniref:Cadherin domain-containing protein n=1 Tax=Hirundo rustica rustica TaxID=333673 RepID=A0A3M0JDB6_HIRRU|nr:hypothetical protein DUI87_26984 [Hirundo rustica rustica]